MMRQMTDTFRGPRLLLPLMVALCLCGVSRPATAYSGKIKETTRYQRNAQRPQTPAPVVIQYAQSPATPIAAALAANGRFATYMNANGAVYFSGINNDGQFGNGSASSSNNNQWVLGPTAAQVATGEQHTLVLFANGSVKGAGDNTYGELGLGNYSSPMKFFSTATTNAGTPLQSITQVAAGRHHSIALDNTGNVWVVGDNSKGELGISAGTQTINYWQQTTATWPASSKPVAVAAGGDFSLVLLYNTTSNPKQYELWGTGRNDYGQLGQGTGNQPQWIQLATDVMPSTLNDPTFAAGWWHTLYIDASGNLWGTGDNSCGQLGTPPSSTAACGSDPLAGTAQYSATFMSPQSSGSGMYFTSVAAGPYASFAILSNGDLYASGDNANGQLGLGSGAGSQQLGFVPVLDNVDSVTGGRYFSLALRQGDVYVAGGIDIGQSFAGQSWSPTWQLAN